MRTVVVLLAAVMVVAFSHQCGLMPGSVSTISSPLQFKVGEVAENRGLRLKDSYLGIFLSSSRGTEPSCR